MVSKPKYPDIVVPNTKHIKSAFAILGRTKRALKNAGISNAEVDAFYKEATSGDYDNLLQVCARWVTIE